MYYVFLVKVIVESNSTFELRGKTSFEFILQYIDVIK